jgi:hypothetical protein
LWAGWGHKMQGLTSMFVVSVPISSLTYVFVASSDERDRRKQNRTSNTKRASRLPEWK